MVTTLFFVIWNHIYGTHIKRKLNAFNWKYIIFIMSSLQLWIDWKKILFISSRIEFSLKNLSTAKLRLGKQLKIEQLSNTQIKIMQISDRITYKLLYIFVFSEMLLSLRSNLCCLASVLSSTWLKHFNYWYVYMQQNAVKLSFK